MKTPFAKFSGYALLSICCLSSSLVRAADPISVAAKYTGCVEELRVPGGKIVAGPAFLDDSSMLTVKQNDDDSRSIIWTTDLFQGMDTKYLNGADEKSDPTSTKWELVAFKHPVDPSDIRWVGAATPTIDGTQAEGMKSAKITYEEFSLEPGVPQSIKLEQEFSRTDGGTGTETWISRYTAKGMARYVVQNNSAGQLTARLARSCGDAAGEKDHKVGDGAWLVSQDEMRAVIGRLESRDDFLMR